MQAEDYGNEAIGKGSTVKKLVRHGGLYFSAKILGRLPRFAVLPVYTAFLPPAQYGMYATTLASAELLAIFMGLRIDAAFGRYFFDLNSSRAELKRLVSTCLIFVVSFGLFVSSIGLVAGYHYHHNVLGIPFLVLIVPVVVSRLVAQVALISRTYFSNTHRSRIIAVTDVVGNILGPVVAVILLVNTRMRVSAIAVSLLLGALVPCIVGLVVMRREGLLGLCLDMLILRKCVYFGLMFLPGVAAAWIYTVSDRIIITVYEGNAETGIYSIAYQLGKVVSHVAESVNMVYMPILLARLSTNYKQGLESLRKPIVAMVWLMLFVCSSFSLFASEILHVMTDSQYHGGTPIMIVVIWSFMWGGIYWPFLNLLYYHKKVLLIGAIGIFSAAVNLVLNLAFVPIYGKMAAAWTTLAASIAYAGLVIIFAYRLNRPPIDWKELGKTGLIWGGLFVCHYFVRSIVMPSWLSVVVRISLIFLALCMTVGLDLLGSRKILREYVFRSHMKP